MWLRPVRCFRLTEMESCVKVVPQYKQWYFPIQQYSICQSWNAQAKVLVGSGFVNIIINSTGFTTAPDNQTRMNLNLEILLP